MRTLVALLLLLAACKGPEPEPTVQEAGADLSAEVEFLKQAYEDFETYARLLEEENERLWAENERLKAELAEKDAEIEELRARQAVMEAQLGELMSRVEDQTASR